MRELSKYIFLICCLVVSLVFSCQLSAQLSDPIWEIDTTDESVTWEDCEVICESGLINTVKIDCNNFQIKTVNSNWANPDAIGTCKARGFLKIYITELYEPEPGQQLLRWVVYDEDNHGTWFDDPMASRTTDEIFTVGQDGLAKAYIEIGIEERTLWWNGTSFVYTEPSTEVSKFYELDGCDPDDWVALPAGLPDPNDP